MNMTTNNFSIVPESSLLNEAYLKNGPNFFIVNFNKKLTITITKAEATDNPVL